MVKKDLQLEKYKSFEKWKAQEVEKELSLSSEF